MTDKTKNRLVVAAVALITLLPMLYGNIVARKGGPLDDCILDTSDPSYVDDALVKSFAPQGLKSGDAVTFLVPFGHAATVDDLAYVKRFTDALKRAFPDYGILSLSVASNYHDTGEELVNKPYISDESLRGLRQNPAAFAAWKDKLKNDPGFYGLLMGRSFDYAQVVMLLKVNYDEIRVFRRVTEFLENRKISDWEWFSKTDITPSGEYASVMPSGWVIGRGLTDAALIADDLKLSTIGLILTGIAFYLSFLSVRQAFIASSIVALCFFWARGSIGLANAAGFAIYERVYFLLVYTSIIVAGISFAARKFEFFNEAREQNPELSVVAVWRKTSSVNGIIGLTALIAILNFGSLYQVGVRGILEMGIFSALGVAYLLVLVLWFMPALHSLVCGDASHAGTKKAFQAGRIWNRLLENMAKGCCRLLDWNVYAPFRYKKPAAASIGIIFVTLAIALVLIGSDIFYHHSGDFRFIQVHTMPLEFINNTIVYRASLFLNKQGNYGFDRMPILVMPKNSSGDEPIADPAFIRRVDAFSERIKTLPDAREVHSIVGTIKVISRESYGLELPAETQQVHDILQTMEWDLGPLLKEQLWFNKGLVLGVSWFSYDSYRTGLLRDRILSLAVHEFTDLQVVPFSKIAVYPNADKYISEGKPLNVVTSQWILFVIFAVWIFIRNRKNNHPRRLDPLKTGLVINAPFVFATSAIVIVMAILRVPLDQSTACITALAINAACDFSIYLVSDYDHALQEGGDMRQALHYSLGDKGKIILVDVVLNALCFVPLMTSSFIPVARLGWIMIIMLLACGFGALVLMPSLLPWCVKKQNA